MKNSLIIISFFIAGIVVGYLEFLPESIAQNDFSNYVLYALIFLVGMTISSDLTSWKFLKREKKIVLLIPAATIIGTFLGVGLASLFLAEINLQQSLAVGAGFGYYSLSSIMIGNLTSAGLGIIALLANISREIITLLLTPLMVRYFGRIAPICSGGATSMDTTLPVITRFCGRQYAVIAILHGAVLTILVPIIITIIVNFF